MVSGHGRGPYGLPDWRQARSAEQGTPPFCALYVVFGLITTRRRGAKPAIVPWVWSPDVHNTEALRHGLCRRRMKHTSARRLLCRLHRLTMATVTDGITGAALTCLAPPPSVPLLWLCAQTASAHVCCACAVHTRLLAANLWTHAAAIGCP